MKGPLPKKRPFWSDCRYSAALEAGVDDAPGGDLPAAVPHARPQTCRAGLRVPAGVPAEVATHRARVGRGGDLPHLPSPTEGGVVHRRTPLRRGRDGRGEGEDQEGGGRNEEVHFSLQGAQWGTMPQLL